MAGEVVDPISTALIEIGRIALFLQGLGIILVFIIVYYVVTLIMNRKRRKALYSIQEDLKRIEKKIDRLSKQR